MSDFFHRNPRLLILAICLIVVSGLSAYAVLPRAEDPELTQRVAIINTVYPGADAERVESNVTDKIEDVLQDIEEIKRVRTTSRPGVSTIVIELRDDIYEPDDTWSRIRYRLSDLTPTLASGVLPPRFDELESKAYAMIVGLTWDLPGDPNYAILRRLAKKLQDDLQQIPGSEKVELYGDPEEEIIVTVTPSEFAAIGLTPRAIARQIQASDAKISAGQVRSNQNELIVEVDSELDTISRIGRTPIHYGDDGRFVMLGDLATVNKSISDPPASVALVDGKRSVALGLFVQSSKRIGIWNEAVEETLQEFESQLPRGISLSTVFQQNSYVQSRLDRLLLNLLMSCAAVIAVIFVMMGFRSAIVIGSALPLSAFMVLSGMRILGIPIHQMSITGLIIALGLLIDNAIVMVDSVSVKLKDGDSPADAVRESVRLFAMPLFCSSLTTALAFAPIALMTGPAGEFVGAIAIGVILAIFSSLLLALTLVPALTAMGLKREPTGSRLSWLSDGFNSRFLRQLYGWTLNFVFRRPALGIILGVTLPIVGFVKAKDLPQQFFPPAERDQVQIELELPATASIADTVRMSQEIRTRLLDYDEIDEIHWFLGESAPSFYYNVVPRRSNTPRYAQALVQLSAAGDTTGIVRRLQSEVDATFPSARVLVRQLNQGPPFDAPIELRLFGPDMNRLNELGQEVRGVLAQTPDITHTRVELAETLPKIELSVDEELARLSGLEHASIASQLNAALEGAVGGAVFEGTEELPVRVRVSREDRARLASMASLDLLPSNGRSMSGDLSPYPGIPLTAVSDVNLSPEIGAVHRFNGRRMNEIQAFIAAGTLPAEVLADFEKRLDESGFKLPPGYSMEYGGEAESRGEAIDNLLASVGVLAVMMIGTLVVAFRSMRIAALIGTVALLSAGLGFISLWLFAYPLGFMALLGMVGLIGVAINDAIVVLAGLREDPRVAEGDMDAIRDVVVHSTRHIVATSLTTIAGFTPLVLGGGGFWPPLAITIAGGVGGATLLALYYVPSLYIVAFRLKSRQPAQRPERGIRSLADAPSAVDATRIGSAAEVLST